MVAITALEVAFVSAIAAVAAAVAAPLSALLVASVNTRHERWVTSYGDLRDAYIGLLRTVYRRQVTAFGFVQAIESGDAAKYRETQAAVAEDAASRVERLALVGVFASGRVLDAIQAWDAAWQDVVDCAAEVRRAEGRDQDPHVAPLRDALSRMDDPVRQLRDEIRADLRKQR